MSVSIERFVQAIAQLPPDAPVYDPQKWYTTQKEHWLGWLSEYHGSGAYGRQTTKERDAKFAYNHIVEPKMLIWLIEAAGIDTQTVNSAKRATMGVLTMQGKSAAIRNLVPWVAIEQRLWGSGSEE